MIATLALSIFEPLITFLKQPDYIFTRFLFAGQFVTVMMVMLPSKEQKLQYIDVFAHFQVFLALSIAAGGFLYVIMRQRTGRFNTRRFWIALGLGIVSLFLGYYFCSDSSISRYRVDGRWRRCSDRPISFIEGGLENLHP